MTEAEAGDWMANRFGREAVTRVAAFVERLSAENAQQNLIAPSTVGTIWTRHVADSAQLLDLAPSGWSRWLDIGTGGGFPGMVVALLAPERAVTMVEPRAKRAAFLQSIVELFQLPKALVAACKVEALPTTADVISARAVAALDTLLRAAGHCAGPTTTWLLPRGRSATDITSQGVMFHVEHSLTDPSSLILVGKGMPK